MKIQTNAGEVELTAEMVCRGLVLSDGRCEVAVLLDRFEDYTSLWSVKGWAPSDSTPPLATCWVECLGCDPTVASRAACERFGVHGDAAAHGFARLRDGGAVDFRREELPNGSAVGFIGGTGRCYSVLRSLTAEERFIGLDARHASPEDVRRLCCLDVASADAEQLDEKGRRWIPRCTLAIGDHDTHEDLATGVKWSAGAERDAERKAWARLVKAESGAILGSGEAREAARQALRDLGVDVDALLEAP